MPSDAPKLTAPRINLALVTFAASIVGSTVIGIYTAGRLTEGATNIVTRHGERITKTEADIEGLHADLRSVDGRLNASHDAEAALADRVHTLETRLDFYLDMRNAGVTFPPRKATVR